MISPSTNLSTPASIKLRQNAFNEITQILNNTEKTFNTTCQQCMSSLLVLQNLTHAVPWEVPPLLIQICNFVHFDGIIFIIYINNKNHSTCYLKLSEVANRNSWRTLMVKCRLNYLLTRMLLDRMERQAFFFCNKFSIGFEQDSFSGFVQEMWSASENHALSHPQMT